MAILFLNKNARAHCPADVITTPWGRLLVIPLTFDEDFAVDVEIVVPWRLMNHRSHRGLNFDPDRPDQPIVHLAGGLADMERELTTLGSSCIARAHQLADLLGYQITSDLGNAWWTWQRQILEQIRGDLDLPSAKRDRLKREMAVR